MTDHCRWKSELRDTSSSSPSGGAGLGQRQTHVLQAPFCFLRAGVKSISTPPTRHQLRGVVTTLAGKVSDWWQIGSAIPGDRLPCFLRLHEDPIKARKALSAVELVDNDGRRHYT